MKNGLKILCIALLLYSVVSAFLHPLAPGIIACDKSTVQPGYNELVVVGYRTHFINQRTSMLVFLDCDSNRYCGKILEVIDNSHVKIGVDIPDTLSSKSLDIYVNNDGDGTLYLPLAVSVNDAVLVKGMKDPASCKFDVKNDDSTYFGYPFQPLIYETIRNLMWHVPMWFTMFFLMILSFVYSLRQLRKVNSTTKNFSSKHVYEFDLKAEVSARAGMVFCILGLLTGMMWARFTWGYYSHQWWINDPQLNGALVVFLIYASYFVLRATVSDEEKRARLSAIYNIFAFVMMVVLLMVMPKFVTSLHPGKEGTPAFSSYDLDSSLRTVFYPAIIGWGMLGYWLYSTHLRIKKIELEINDRS
ncbi:MAG: cytochrome c biogenesis protein CcsA [Flavobacteriales bacterium]|nr:cytochrome c biogenesis protein CcsA [Flavobacteriales bacterium]